MEINSLIVGLRLLVYQYKSKCHIHKCNCLNAKEAKERLTVNLLSNGKIKIGFRQHGYVAR